VQGGSNKDLLAPSCSCLLLECYIIHPGGSHARSQVTQHKPRAKKLAACGDGYLRQTLKKLHPIMEVKETNILYMISRNKMLLCTTCSMIILPFTVCTRLVNNIDSSGDDNA
jgi:hypothetical protein